MPAEIVIAVGVPTVGVIFTARATGMEGPLQPSAITWMLTLPANPLVQVITPVEGSIDPARELVLDQVKPVLFVAVVV